MNKRPPSHVLATVLCAALAAFFSLGAHAHCGANEECVYSPCHHGANSPECQAATGAAKITSKIAEPAVQEAVREIIIPKVPQLKLPVSGAAKPDNAPAPLGKIDTNIAPLIDPRPLPPGLPASAIAHDVVPQIYAGTLAVTREIDNARALEALQKNNPRLANSAWLNEHRQIKMGEAFEQLQRIDKRARQAKDLVDGDSRYLDMSESLRNASALLQSFDGSKLAPGSK